MERYSRNIYLEEKLLYKLYILCKNDSINITVYKEETAWNCKVDKNDLVRQSKNQNIELEDYTSTLIKYLKSDIKDVELIFINGNLKINVLLTNKMKSLYFQCTLEKVDFLDSIFNLVDILFQERAGSLCEVNSLKENLQKIKIDNEIMEKKLNEFYERKQSEEKQLYAKFLTTLNEKKRNIQHLNEMLLAFKKGRPAVNPVVYKKGNKKDTGKKTHNRKGMQVKMEVEDSIIKSSSEESRSYTTDEENKHRDDEIKVHVPTGTPKHQFDPFEAIPSTSNAVFDFLNDPPSTSLKFTKRIRSVDNSNSSVTLPDKQKLEHIENESLEPVGLTHLKKEPTVNFSTQDLLDNL